MFVFLNSKRGFTLLEIMIAVTIVVMFSTIVGVAVYRRFQEAQEKTAIVQIRNIEAALADYRRTCYQYPTTDRGLDALISSPGSGCDDWQGPYLDSKKVPLDPWKNPYIYVSPGSHGDFDLESYGPDGDEGGGDDVQNWELE